MISKLLTRIDDGETRGGKAVGVRPLQRAPVLVRRESFYSFAAMVPVPVLLLLARALAAMGRRPGNALFS